MSGSPSQRTALLALRRLAALTTLFLIALILMGGFVTASDSGLGCGPEWPLCHGSLLPPAGDFHAWVEGLHRVLAGLVTVGIAAVAASARRARRALADSRTEQASTLALVAAGLIALEIILGLITVVAKIPAGIVALHMADAVILLGLLLSITRLTWTAVASTKGGVPQVSRTGIGGATWPRVTAAVVAVLTAALGSYVSHSTVADPCASGHFACVGLVGTPAGSGLWVVGLHVLFAVLLGIVFMGFVAPRRTGVGPLFHTASLLYATQVLLGVLLLWSGLDPVVLWVHEAVGTTMTGLWVSLALVPEVRAAAEASSIAQTTAAPLA